MSVRILTGNEYGDETEYAALFDSVTETAFGTLFRPGFGRTAAENAQHFLEWMDQEGLPDPRTIPAGKLEGEQYRWFRAQGGE